ncbi:ZinT/AdcA family metal-binding protein [Eubacterium ruminantium]|uniref:ZinT/AdcA family metal-binding protein n=1 Tax=Eubacterium ruminantium TaxID=42322 RepID=UPI001569AFAC|nr:ZinT/AdcA family metal-binding protein [Eubacterium ruminantium]
MAKNKRFTTAFLLGSFMLLAAGCGKKNDSDQKIVDVYDIKEEKMDCDDQYRSLKEWEGTWESFVDYCDNPGLNREWTKISEEVNIDEDKLKDTFKEICYVTDDVRYFHIKGNTIIGFDSNNNKVFSDKYKVVAEYSEDSPETVIEGEVSYLLQAESYEGRYSYICIMPICTMEEGNGMKMLKHFHFNYGETVEQATDRSRIPTMIEKEDDEKKKAETLTTFFLGTKD